MQGAEACVIVLQGREQRDTCRRDCRTLGGDLVSIHSERENGLVLDLIRVGQESFRPAYIGIENCRDRNNCYDDDDDDDDDEDDDDDDDDDDEFEWVDRSVKPYSNFQPGLPRG